MSTTQENYELFTVAYAVELKAPSLLSTDALVEGWKALFDEAAEQGLPVDMILAWFREAYEQGGLDVYSLGSDRTDTDTRQSLLPVEVRR